MCVDVFTGNPSYSSGGTGCCGSCCNDSFNKDSFDAYEAKNKENGGKVVDQPQANEGMIVPQASPPQPTEEIAIVEKPDAH
jgi:hypothetical protein